MVYTLECARAGRVMTRGMALYTAAVTTLLISGPLLGAAQSCVGSCGLGCYYLAADPDAAAVCCCDDACVEKGDCCDDYER